ncbi:hypothetical protein [Azospirillum sp.]|uniref:hypothetical protein n=1 Tax=Azospirillum sp. TaxID=34012 RepID=UPI002D6B0C70|nr:hypothetical protein [Azospirillum sp.]HYF89702.1 hypothetical protein [Azospirillum sp.]
MELQNGQLSLRSEDDLWSVIADMVYSNFSEVLNIKRIVIDGWGCELLRIPQEESSTSIKTSIMDVLLEYQKCINRGYSVVKYNSASRRLSGDEKKFLEIDVLVFRNGRGYSFDADQSITDVAKAVVEKMESKHLATVAISCFFIWAVGNFGATMFREYVQSGTSINDANQRTEQAKINAEKDIQREKEETERSKQETERTRLIGELAAKSAQSAATLEQVRLGHNALLRGVIAAGGARVLGVDVTSERAEELLQKPRASRNDGTLSGQFDVTEIQRKEHGVFSVDVRHLATGEELCAEARELFLTEDQMNILFKALRTGTPVNASVNVSRSDGKVTGAGMVRVDSLE